MLIDEPAILHNTDPILAIIAAVNGRDPKAKHLRTGVYEIGHFGSSNFLPYGYENYPDNLPVGSYGVCDSVEQLLEACPKLEAQDRKFVVTVTPIRKADQPSEGGWRWHKWGEYVGKHEPQCEYLHDEPDIDEVLVYSIYEKVLP